MSHVTGSTAWRVELGNGRYLNLAASESMGEPTRPPKGHIVNFIGMGWDLREEAAGRRRLFHGNLPNLERCLMRDGISIISVSYSGYDPQSFRGLSIDGYLNDLATVIRAVEGEFGKVAIMGHSIGAYTAMLLLLRLAAEGNPHRGAAIALPLSPREPIETAVSLYERAHKGGWRWISPVIAHLGVDVINAWTKANYLGHARALSPKQALFDEAIRLPQLDELVGGKENGYGTSYHTNGHRQLNRSDVLLIFGTKDPTLFQAGGISFARQQTAEEYRMRCAAITDNVMQLRGKGHNLEHMSKGELETLATNIGDFLFGGG